MSYRVVCAMGTGSGEVPLHRTTRKFFSPPSSLMLISLLNGVIPGARRHGWVAHGDVLGVL